MDKVSFVSDKRATELLRSRKQDVLPAQEDPLGEFYEAYRKEAEGFDKEFMKKYDEDLNTTLIFVSFFRFCQRVLTGK